MPQPDLTFRYACSLYVDHRIGLLSEKPASRDDAYALTAEVYGNAAAEHARAVCD